MALKWGPEVRSSDNMLKVGVNLTQSPTSVTASTTSVKITAQVYGYAQYPVYDTSNSYAVSGNFSDSKAVPFNTSGGSILLGTYTRTVTPSYTGTTTTSINVSITGLQPFGGATARVSHSIVTGKRPVSPPKDPSNAYHRRTDDRSHSIFWTAGTPTAAQPTDRFELQRWSESDPVYKTVASSISKTATSFIDKGTVANNWYRWRIRSRNSAGDSAWVPTPYVRTSPNSPRDPVAKKVGQGIQVNWSRYAYDQAQYEVQQYANGVAVTPTIITAANAWSATVPNPDTTKVHAFRVRARYTDPEAGLLVSAWTPMSNTVQLLSPPSAPADLSPNGSTLADGDDLILKWRHVPVDTTDQSAYEIEWRLLGSTTWTSTGKKASGTSSHNLGALSGPQIEWRVRTWGDHATASPWSLTGAFRVAERPVVAVTSPAGDVDRSSLVLEWSFYDPAAQQVRWEANLYDMEDKLLEARSGNNANQSVKFNTKLTDAGQYRVTVRARNGYLLWSDLDDHAFTVYYALPPIPTLEGLWNPEEGVVALTVSAGLPAGDQVDTSYLEVFKSEDGSDWALVASNLENYVAILDPIPRTNSVIHYRAVAHSSLPSSNESAAIAVLTASENSWVFWNWGPGFRKAARARFDLKPTDKPSPVDKLLQHFHGRDYPVEYMGSGRSHTFNLSFSLDEESSTKALFTDLSFAPAPICYRLPSGEKQFVSMDSISFDESKQLGDFTREVHVSMSMSKVDFSE